MNIPYCVLKEQKGISSKCFNFHQNLAKNMYHLLKKQKFYSISYNRTLCNYSKHKIYKWLFNLDLSKRLKVCSIYNNWFSKIVFQLLAYNDYDDSIKFYPTKIHENYYALFDTCFNEEIYDYKTNMPKNGENDMEKLELFFEQKKMSNSEYNCNNKSQREKNFLKELKFITIDEYNDTLTLSSELLNSREKLTEYFDNFTNCKIFEDNILPIKPKKEQNIFNFSLPSWVKERNFFSIQEIIVISFEQIISVYYQIASIEKEFLNNEFFPQIDDLLAKNKNLENYLSDSSNEEDIKNIFNFDIVSEDINSKTNQDLMNYYENILERIYEFAFNKKTSIYFKDQDSKPKDIYDTVLYLKSEYQRNIPQFLNEIFYIDSSIAFKTKNLVYNLIYQKIDRLFSKKNIDDLCICSPIDKQKKNKNKKKIKKPKRNKRNKKSKLNENNSNEASSINTNNNVMNENGNDNNNIDNNYKNTNKTDNDYDINTNNSINNCNSNDEEQNVMFCFSCRKPFKTGEFIEMENLNEQGKKIKNEDKNEVKSEIKDEIKKEVKDESQNEVKDDAKIEVKDENQNEDKDKEPENEYILKELNEIDKEKKKKKKKKNRKNKKKKENKNENNEYKNEEINIESNNNVIKIDEIKDKSKEDQKQEIKDNELLNEHQNDKDNNNENIEDNKNMKKKHKEFFLFPIEHNKKKKEKKTKIKQIENNSSKKVNTKSDNENESDDKSNISLSNSTTTETKISKKNEINENCNIRNNKFNNNNNDNDNDNDNDIIINNNINNESKNINKKNNYYKNILIETKESKIEFTGKKSMTKENESECEKKIEENKNNGSIDDMNKLEYLSKFDKCQIANSNNPVINNYIILGKEAFHYNVPYINNFEQKINNNIIVQAQSPMFSPNYYSPSLMPTFNYSNSYQQQQNYYINEQNEPFIDLSNEIITHEKNVCDNLEILKKYREEILNKVKDYIKEVMEENNYKCELINYGSYETKLNIEISDIDVLIKFCYQNLNSINSGNQYQVLSLLYDKLNKKKEDYNILSIKAIFTASIPVLKIKCNLEDIIPNKKIIEIKNIYDFNIEEEILQLNFDFTVTQVNNLNEEVIIPSLEIVPYIKKVMSNYSEIKPLILLLKRYMKINKLNSSYTGGLSSYSLFLLVYAFVKSMAFPANNLGQYLLGFLEFYSNFNFGIYSINVNLNNPFILLTELHECGMMLMDPITNLNVAKSTFKVDQIKSVLTKGAVNIRNVIYQKIVENNNNQSKNIIINKISFLEELFKNRNKVGIMAPINPI